MLFHWTNTIKIQLHMLVLYKKQLVLTMIELNNCSLSVKQQLLTHATATYSRNSYLLTQQLLTHATATYSRRSYLLTQQLFTHATATYSHNSYLLTQQLLTHANIISIVRNTLSMKDTKGVIRIWISKKDKRTNSNQ